MKIKRAKLSISKMAKVSRNDNCCLPVANIPTNRCTADTRLPIPNTASWSVIVATEALDQGIIAELNFQCYVDA